MDLWIELLQDPAYLHVLLNHFPLTGLGFAGLVLAWGTIEGRWRSMLFGLALVIVASASVLLVIESGEDAYPFVFDALDGISRRWLDHHAYLADRWGSAVLGNGVLAALALGLGHRRPDWRRPLAIAVLVSTTASLLAASVVAEAGGQIRHAEFRLSDPPIHDEPGRLR